MLKSGEATSSRGDMSSFTKIGDVGGKCCWGLSFACEIMGSNETVADVVEGGAPKEEEVFNEGAEALIGDPSCDTVITAWSDEGSDRREVDDATGRASTGDTFCGTVTTWSDEESVGREADDVSGREEVLKGTAGVAGAATGSSSIMKMGLMGGGRFWFTRSLVLVSLERAFTNISDTMWSMSDSLLPLFSSECPWSLKR